MFNLDRFLPYLLNRAGVRLATAFTNQLKRHDLTLPQWRILAALWHHGEQIGTDLIGETTIEQSTLSRLLAALDQRGLIERERGKHDGRAVTVRLSPKGRKLTAQLIPLALHNESVALKGFSPEEVETLQAMLRRVFDNAGELDGKD